jgi:hypothetical protein
MRKSATSLIATSHRLKKLTGYALCLMLLTWAGWSGCERLLNPERPRGAAHSRTDIATRALRIGTVLNGPAHLLAPPAFMMKSGHTTANSSFSHNAWIVLCEAGNQQVNMAFDDRSGRVVCLLMSYSSMNKGRNLLLPTVKTPSEAATVAVERLKALEVLPQGAQIALQETPKEREGQGQWDMIWLVRTSPTSVPYTIKISINKNTGLPTSMMDMHTVS